MKRWLVFLLLVLLALGAGVWWWLAGGNIPARPIVLSDGSVITYRGATFGTNQTWYGGVAGQRLARVVPAKWRRWLGLRGPSVTTVEPTLMFWVSVSGPASRTGANIHFALGDAGGFSPVAFSARISSGTPGGDTIEGWGFGAFPRRGRTVTLRLYEPGTNWTDMKLRGEFTVRNPAPRHDPPWQPEPLPASRTNEQFTVTLMELLVGASTSNLQQPKPAPNEPEAGVRAVFQFMQDGQPTREWAAASMVMTDATGNRANSSSWSGTWQGNDYVAGFKPFLWMDEAAWNVKFEFSRQTNFAPSESWIVRDVPLGVADLTNNPAFGTNLQGASIQIESVRPRSDYGSDKTRQNSSVKFRIKPGREDYRLTLVNAVDEQGRDAPQYGSSWGGGDHTFDLGVETNAVSLTLTLALHQSRYEEFRVKPVRFQSGRTNDVDTAK